MQTLTTQAHTLTHYGRNVGGMATRPSCSLCGAPFRAPGAAVDQQTIGRHWNAQVRGIRGDKSSVDITHPRLTGPGYISGSQLVASLDARDGLLAENVPDNRRDLSIFGDATPIIYALHEFCWQTLLQRLGITTNPDADDGAGPEAAAVAAWLFYLLAALPYSRAVGLITQDGYSGNLPIDGPEIRQADPRMDLHVSVISSIEPPDHRMKPASLFRSGKEPDERGDAFSRLPLEILHYLLGFLDSKDLCSTRLASRCFALSTIPAVLPQQFWTSRFAYEKEMGWIDTNALLDSHFPFFSGAVDYYQLYQKCREALRIDDLPEGLHNRRRIWSVLGHFAATLRALLTVKKVWETENTSQLPDVPPGHLMGQVVCCPNLSSASAGPGSLVFGSRIRHAGILDLVSDLPSKHGICLRYWSIIFDERTYISGIEVSKGQDVNLLGLMVPAAIGSVYLEPGTIIYEVDVYISIAGIHGMIVHAKTPDGRAVAHSIGDTAPIADADIAVTRLESDGRAGALMLGFDMFKLSLLQLLDRPKNSQHTVPSDPVLWKSALPPKGAYQPTLARPSKDPLTLSSFLMHLYIPFGGEEGSRLSSLIRVTALLDGAIGLHGLIFTYDDGEETLYGARVSPRFAGPSRVCVEESFLIDGPGGERIEQLVFSSRTGSDALRVGYPGISAMEFTTNFNRRHTFRAFDNYGNVRSMMQKRTVQRSPDGQCPTVFTIGLGAPAWFFETAEISDFVPVPEISEQAVMGDMTESAPTDQALASCPWMLSVGGSVFTTASLASVHRIRISAGERGRSRSDAHISGLWLEYRTKGHDTILGQWMREIDQFTLKPHETIVGIEVRCTKEIELRGTGGVVGKVVCLLFITSLGNKYEFRQSQAPAESHLRYYGTPYEDLGTVTWAFNSNSDDIQMSLEPAPRLGPGGQLLLCDADTNLRHPWLLQENTRIFYKYGDMAARKIRHDISIHRGDAARRYTSQCDMLFWEERDPKGSGRMLRLLRLEVMSQDGIVDGFRFEYEDGLVKTFGAQDSDKQVMDFTKHKDERPSCLTVYYITDSRSSLEIHTTRGKVCRVYPDKEISNQADSHAMVRGVRAPKLTLTADHRKSGHHDFPDTNPSGNPVSECVGIWVAGPPRYQSTIPYVDSFGPVYRTNPQGEASSDQGLRHALRGLLKRDT